MKIVASRERERGLWDNFLKATNYQKSPHKKKTKLPEEVLYLSKKLNSELRIFQKRNLQAHMVSLVNSIKHRERN